MNLKEMRDEVTILVQDGSYVTADVDKYINRAFTNMAGQINLPDLKRVDTITTVVGQSYTSLAALSGGFNGRLSKVHAENITIYPSLEDLISGIEEDGELFGEAGDVTRLALEGSTVWYDKIPAVPQTLMAILYGNPPLLVADADIPSVFPEHTHWNIGIHGAAMLMFDPIEDGVTGEKVNTTYHEGLYLKGKQEALEWIARNRTHSISSRWSD